jgi:hypothetical protein
MLTSRNKVPYIKKGGNHLSEHAAAILDFKMAVILFTGKTTVSQHGLDILGCRGPQL